mmetsp:Transcript_71401/g.107954  ORF Transcript_71401/g.107954 Transcript_71401/m.107954 type:complete len:123 (+) Transcript_71401:579-947(+)
MDSHFVQRETHCVSSKLVVIVLATTIAEPSAPIVAKNVSGNGSEEGPEDPTERPKNAAANEKASTHSAQSACAASRSATKLTVQHIRGDFPRPPLMHDVQGLHNTDGERNGNTPQCPEAYTR